MDNADENSQNRHSINDYASTCATPSTNVVSLTADGIRDTTKEIKLLSAGLNNGTVWIDGIPYPARDISIDYAIPGGDEIVYDTPPKFARGGVITGTVPLVGEGSYSCIIPMACSASMFTGTQYSRFSRQEIRSLRKKLRDKESKKLLRRIASNPMFAEQDRRKLRRLGRRQAEHLQRVLGIRTTYRLV